MGQTLRWLNDELQEHTCGECGVEFAMTATFVESRKKDRRTWYCPNGHPRVFTGQTAEQIRIAVLERSLASETNARKWAETKARGASIAAGKAKAAKRRLEHRVNCGTCPHCKRTFKQLAAHMKSKHPEVSR